MKVVTHKLGTRKEALIPQLLSPKYLRTSKLNDDRHSYENLKTLLPS